MVLLTIAVSIGTISSHSQKDTSKINDDGVTDDLSKYAVVDYDAPESANAVERKERKLKNSRYDKQDWVLKNPHPDDGGVGRYDEAEPPPIIPADESDLVIVGKIIDVSAHLSNDRQGVYSEFVIQADKILKNDISKEVEQGKLVTADRAGGFVRYPNGQKVIYRNSERGLPYVGNEYVFFLTKDKISPNYQILTLYELKDAEIIQLDYGRNFEDFKKSNKQDFIESVRNKILESSTDEKSRRKP
jgi:hypothetical protein